MPFWTLLTLLLGSVVHAGVSAGSSLHWSGDKTVWDRKANRVELVGHAAVHQVAETIIADTIFLDLETRTMDARGNCIYVTAGMVMYGEEMHFNLDTRTGSIVSGRVVSDTFTLTGERINRLAAKRFQTHLSEYTTCQDCPGSWTLRGHDVEMEVGNYSLMEGVTARVKEAPVAWAPFLLFPIRTERTSGLLFPRWGYVQNYGTWFMQPLYVVLGKYADATFAAGVYGGRGFRSENEFRYLSGKRSGGQVNYNFMHDSSFPQLTTRWGLIVNQTQELPWGIDQKLRIADEGDVFYHTVFSEVPTTGGAYTTSELIFSKTEQRYSIYGAGRRFRNLLDTTNVVLFDKHLVQVEPTIGLSVNDWTISTIPGVPVTVGVEAGLTRFSRSMGSIDNDPELNNTGIYQPGLDPIRRATRFNFTPKAYTTLRPMSVFSVVPSIQYRTFFYDFGHAESIQNLTRGYPLVQIDFATQLEKVYEMSDPDIPRWKHLLRPLVTYNYIPTKLIYEQRYRNIHSGVFEKHPFVQQIDYSRANGFSGFTFDNYDVVPMDSSQTYNNYFDPLGNSITYGFTTQIIRRRSRLSVVTPGYQRMFELSAGQNFNFKELEKPIEEQKPFSRVFAITRLNLDQFSFGVDYTYVPYLPIVTDDAGQVQKGRQNLSVSTAVVFERAVHQKVLAFERSFQVTYNRITVGSLASTLNGSTTFSITDNIFPQFGATYDFLKERLLGFNTMLRIQSPSRCWRFDILANSTINPDPAARSPISTTFAFEFALNLTGSGFGTISDTATSIMSRGQ